jgi:hypothetical protein
MILVTEHVVVYKDAMGAQQQRVTFPSKEAAQAFAYAVEKDGGIALYTSGYRSSNVSNAPAYRKQ